MTGFNPGFRPGFNQGLALATFYNRKSFPLESCQYRFVSSPKGLQRVPNKQKTVLFYFWDTKAVRFRFDLFLIQTRVTSLLLFWTKHSGTMTS